MNGAAVDDVNRGLSVLRAAEEAPEHPAILVGERAISYGALAERVSRAIGWLRHLGVGSTPAPVALVAYAEPRTFELLYALIELGVPALLVHPRWTERERKELYATVPDAFVLDNALREAPRAGQSARRAATANETGANASLTLPEHIPPETPLAVVFTSGTTGRPKGVVLSRRAFFESAATSARNLAFYPDDRWLLTLPIAHVGGLSVLTRCLIARKTVVLPPELAAEGRIEPAALSRSVVRDRVTLLSLVPAQLDRWLADARDWTPPSHVRAILLGGASASPALLARAVGRGWPVLTTYGLTEACSQVTTQKYGTENRGEQGSGDALPGMQVRIVDGVIRVRGPSLFSRYLDDAASGLDADGWLTTEDCGHIDEHGRLHVLGRRDEVIVTGGENVHPCEVERVLDACPGIAASCVFAVEDARYGQRVAAALVADQTAAQPDDAELVQFLSGHLASFKQPRDIAWLDALASATSGKVDRRETARRAIAHLKRLRG